MSAVQVHLYHSHLALLLIMTCLWPAPLLAQQVAQKKTPDTSVANTQLSPKQQMKLHTETLRAWMLSLYQQYPNELAKSTQVGPNEMVEWVFEGKNNWKFEAIRSLQGHEALSLLFDTSYQGDQVLALVVGLESLLFNAYGAKNDFAIPSDIGSDKLYPLICDLRQWQTKIGHTQSALQSLQTTSILLSPQFQNSFNHLMTNVIAQIQINLPKKVMCSGSE